MGVSPGIIGLTDSSPSTWSSSGCIGFYDLLKGKATKGDNDGHLVVVSGWDQSQHVIVNDPAKCPMVRTSLPCKCFLRGWNASHRTVYIILPNGLNMPEELTEIQWMDSAS